MKKQKNVVILALIIMSFVLLTGCQQSEQTANDEVVESNMAAINTDALEVRFGYDGEPFTVHLEDNETAVTIARDVGITDWNLQLFHYDDFEDADVMQFYDIPDSYEIPSNPETVTTEKAGEVYYSDPNRIILFYQDGQVSGEYTRVGYIDNSEDFYNAVIDNLVLEQWNTKIIVVSPEE